MDSCNYIYMLPGKKGPFAFITCLQEYRPLEKLDPAIESKFGCASETYNNTECPYCHKPVQMMYCVNGKAIKG